MSDAIDELYSAIEKAKGLIPGGSSRMRSRVHQASKEGRSSPRWSLRQFKRLERADTYLGTRRKGGPVTGKDFQRPSRFFVERTGSYK